MSDPSDIQKDLIVGTTTVAAAGVTAAALYKTQTNQILENTLANDAILKEQPERLYEASSEAVRGEMLRQHEAAMAEVEKVQNSSRFKKMAEKVAEKTSKAIGPKLDKAKQAWEHLSRADSVDYVAFKPNEAGRYSAQVHLNAEALEKITKGSEAAGLLFKPEFNAAGKAVKGSYSLFDIPLPKLPAGASFKEAEGGIKRLKGEHLEKLDGSWLSDIADVICKNESKLEAAVPELTVNASTIRKAAPMGFGLKLMPAGAKFEIATWAVVAAVAGTYVGGFLANSLQRSRLSKAAPQTVGEPTPFSR